MEQGEAGGGEGARVEGHALARLGALSARCECGWEADVSRDDAAGVMPSRLRDLLMDRHSEHLERVMARRGG